MPEVKKGWWDGKIRLLNKDTSILYAGLLGEVRKFCSQRSYKLETSNVREKPAEIDPRKLKEIIMSWKPTKWKDGIKNGERELITPYEEQFLAIWLTLMQERLILESATSAGKSFIIWALIRLLGEGKKTLIIVPRVALVDQLYDNQFEYFEDWGIGTDRLYTGKELTEQPVVISTWQSICKMPPEYFKQFDILIEDEVHRGEAKTTCQIVENCIAARYRVGLTGTLKDSITHRLTLNGLFGKDYLVSTAQDNIDKGISAPLDITIFKSRWKTTLRPDGDKFAQGERYHKELEYIHTCPERNQLIRNLSKASKGTNVVLFKYKKHGQLLFDLLKEDNPNTFLVYGEVSPAQRYEITEFVINNPEENINIVASVGTFADGINIPNIRSAILTCPLKGENTTLRQAIGRGLRLKRGGLGFKFFDIADYVGSKSILGDHHEQRMEKYIEQRFHYKVVNY